MQGARVTDETDFVARWMQIAAPVREEVLRALPHKHEEGRCRAAEQASILHSLDNLMSYPWIRRRVDEASWPCTAGTSTSTPARCWPTRRASRSS